MYVFPPAKFFGSVSRIADRATIPFVQDNTDCAQFLSDWQAGATVTNADGSPAPYSDDAAQALGIGTTSAA